MIRNDAFFMLQDGLGIISREYQPHCSSWQCLPYFYTYVCAHFRDLEAVHAKGMIVLWEDEIAGAGKSERWPSECTPGRAWACPLRINNKGYLLFCPLWWHMNLAVGREAQLRMSPSILWKEVHPTADCLPHTQGDPCEAANRVSLHSLRICICPTGIRDKHHRWLLHSCAEKEKTNRTWDDKEDKGIWAGDTCPLI